MVNTKKTGMRQKGRIPVAFLFSFLGGIMIPAF